MAFLVLVSILTLVGGEVIGEVPTEKCANSYGYFSNYFLNATGLIVSETNEPYLLSCASKCQRDHRCISANFAENTQCQLFTVDEETVHAEKKLTHDIQWTHISLLGWPNTSFSNNSILPTLLEKTNGFISVGYNSLTNKYHRASNADEVIENWQSATFTSINIARYETATEPTTGPTTTESPITHETVTLGVSELPDVYAFLQRESNDSSAEISWKFDFSDTLLRVSELNVKGTMYSNCGNITHSVCDADSICIEGSGVDITSSEFAGANVLTVKFTLSGDPGENPILFPVSIYEPDEYGLYVNITLTDECQLLYE